MTDDARAQMEEDFRQSTTAALREEVKATLDESITLDSDETFLRPEDYISYPQRPSQPVFPDMSDPSAQAEVYFLGQQASEWEDNHPFRDLLRFQRAVGGWARMNFPDETTELLTLGVAEETGELAHAILKRAQKIRGSAEQHEAAARDAIGDIIVYLAHLCELEGWTLAECLRETWGAVAARTIADYPVDAVVEPPEAEHGAEPTPRRT